MSENWIYKAINELEDSLEKGEITQVEFHREMRHLREEVEGHADEAAEETYKNIMGC